MDKKSLVIIDGFDSNYERAYKIIAIEDHETPIFRGIGLDSSQCDLSDENAILMYLGEHRKDLNSFSLIAGVATPTRLQYSNYVSGKKLTFGTFEVGEYGFDGREKVHENGRMKRDLERTVRHYAKPQKLDHCSHLYELIDYILLSQRKNGTWLGIQASVEGTYYMNVESMNVIGVLPNHMFKAK